MSESKVITEENVKKNVLKTFLKTEVPLLVLPIESDKGLTINVNPEKMLQVFDAFPIFHTIILPLNVTIVITTTNLYLFVYAVTVLLVYFALNFLVPKLKLESHYVDLVVALMKLTILGMFFLFFYWGLYVTVFQIVWAWCILVGLHVLLRDPETIRPTTTTVTTKVDQLV